MLVNEKEEGIRPSSFFAIPPMSIAHKVLYPGVANSSRKPPILLLKINNIKKI